VYRARCVQGTLDSTQQQSADNSATLLETYEYTGHVRTGPQLTVILDEYGLERGLPVYITYCYYSKEDKILLNHSDSEKKESRRVESTSICRLP
jgi:hypothetical protein